MISPSGFLGGKTLMVLYSRNKGAKRAMTTTGRTGRYNTTIVAVARGPRSVYTRRRVGPVMCS